MSVREQIARQKLKRPRLVRKIVEEHVVLFGKNPENRRLQDFLYLLGRENFPREQHIAAYHVDDEGNGGGLIAFEDGDYLIRVPQGGNMRSGDNDCLVGRRYGAVKALVDAAGSR